MSLNERQQQVIQEFNGIQSWEDRYKLIIDLGKKLPELAPEKKTEDAKVKGCQSQVWLHAELSPDGRVILAGDSDALIVRGLVAVLLRIYSGSTPAEILQSTPSFLQELGFKENLSPSRANGLFSMLKQIQHFATAFAYLQQSKR